MSNLFSHVIQDKNATWAANRKQEHLNTPIETQNKAKLHHFLFIYVLSDRI